jgi:hypothetical protein
VLVEPSTLRRPGSITEKISFIKTVFPPPFSRNSTLAGDGRRRTPTLLSVANNACWTRRAKTGPTSRRSIVTSW